jgi:hypothetical protein
MPPLPPAPPDPTLSEREAFRTALRGSFVEIVRFLIPRVDAPEQVEAELLAALRDDETLAPGVGKAILALPSASRQRLLPSAARDARPAVRRALFREWAPEQLEVPRANSALLPPAEWRALLRSTLGDDDLDVRTSAAALAFDSGAAGGLSAELLLALDGDRGLAWRALLGLGQARDAASLQRLIAVARGEDSPLAAAAVRALAARTDGHAAWQAAFADARSEVRSAALFGLARVAGRLEPVQLAELERAALQHEPPDIVVQALSAYRRRHMIAS